MPASYLLEATFATVLTTLVCCVFRFITRRNRPPYPPGPKLSAIPFIGNMFDMPKDQGFFSRLLSTSCNLMTCVVTHTEWIKYTELAKEFGTDFSRVQQFFRRTQT
jgi:hypothetical protein